MARFNPRPEDWNVHGGSLNKYDGRRWILNLLHLNPRPVTQYTLVKP